MQFSFHVCMDGSGRCLQSEDKTSVFLQHDLLKLPHSGQPTTECDNGETHSGCLLTPLLISWCDKGRNCRKGRIKTEFHFPVDPNMNTILIVKKSACLSFLFPCVHAQQLHLAFPFHCRFFARKYRFTQGRFVDPAHRRKKLKKLM